MTDPAFERALNRLFYATWAPPGRRPIRTLDDLTFRAIQDPGERPNSERTRNEP